MKELVSIIIPIYNVERYLEKCLESIINQTYKNLEILLIDDGSTDGSGLIIDKYAEKDDRIKVIHKKNTGVSDTRNVGINSSIGKYIFFVDSDDYLDLDVIENLMINIKYADIVKVSHKIIKNNKETNIICNNGVFSKEEYIGKILSGNIGGHSWGYILRRDIIEEIYFDTNTSCMEDTIFIIRCILKSKKIKCIDNSFYNHLINENGITASTNRVLKNINDYIYSLNNIEEIINREYDDFKKYIDIKRLKILEAEICKLRNRKEIELILLDNKIDEVLNKILNNKSIKINLFYKIFIYAIINKKVNILIFYCKSRKFMKKIYNLIK